jgi:hypothetical protein
MRIVAYLYGDELRANEEHIPRVFWLSATLCCIIGSFWLLDSLKDTVFATLVGLEHQPAAKVISVFITLALVLYYNSLLDHYETPTVKHQLYFCAPLLLICLTSFNFTTTTVILYGMWFILGGLHSHRMVFGQ